MRKSFQSEISAQEYIKQADLYYQSGDYTSALEACNNALRKDPKNLTALDYRGRVKHVLGDYEGSIKDLTKVLERDSNSVHALGSRASAKMMLGRHQAALIDANEALRHEHNNIFALQVHAAISVKLGHHEDSIKDLDKVLDLDPKNVYALDTRARAKMILGYYQEADIDINAILTLDPKNTSALSLREIAQKQRPKEKPSLAIEGQFNKLSIQSTKKKVQINSNNSSKTQLSAPTSNKQIFSGLVLSQKLNANNEANASKKMQKIKEDLAKAKKYHEADNNKEAIKILNIILNDQPNHVMALCYRGAAKRMLDLNEEALTDLNKALKFDSNNVYALEVRGAVKNEMGHPEEAIEDLDKALKIEPNSSFGIEQSAIANSKLGRYEEAIAILDKLLTTEPNNTLALNHRGNANGYLGRFSEAIKDYNKLLMIDPNDDYALKMRGQAKRQLELFEEAIEDFKKSLAIKPNNTWTLQKLEEAKKELERRNSLRKEAMPKKNSTIFAQTVQNSSTANIQRALGSKPAITLQPNLNRPTRAKSSKASDFTEMTQQEFDKKNMEHLKKIAKLKKTMKKDENLCVLAMARGYSVDTAMFMLADDKKALQEAEAAYKNFQQANASKVNYTQSGYSQTDNSKAQGRFNTANDFSHRLSDDEDEDNWSSTLSYRPGPLGEVWAEEVTDEPRFIDYNQKQEHTFPDYDPPSDSSAPGTAESARGKPWGSYQGGTGW